jgi:serine/threonine-protein kinase
VAILDQIRISFNTSAQASFSGTGTLAYVPGRSDDRKLIWVDRNGRIEPLPAPPRAYSTPRLSPDGQRVATWTITGDILIYDLSRGTLTRAAPEGTSSWPIWTPDGKRLIYRAAREGTRNLFWRAADGTGTEERLTTGANPQSPGSWSPDGRVLAFRDSNPTTDNDVWLLQLDGRAAQPFLQASFSEHLPMFSRDGRWLAYQSNESGRSEIYVRPFPGPGPRSQVSTEGGTEPVWNPSGRELFYRNGDKLMAVDVATQPAFSASTPRLLFEGDYLVDLGNVPGYDVSLDGQRFLMAIPTAPASDTQIHVVLNWFEELKRRVPPGVN